QAPPKASTAGHASVLSSPGDVSGGTTGEGDMGGFNFAAPAPDALSAAISPDLISSFAGGAGSSLAGAAEGVSSAAALESLSNSAAGLGGSAAFSAIAAIPGIWEMGNDIMQAINTRQARLRETEGIRGDFSQGFPIL